MLLAVHYYVKGHKDKLPPRYDFNDVTLTTKLNVTGGMVDEMYLAQIRGRERVCVAKKYKSTGALVTLKFFYKISKNPHRYFLFVS